jgi:hypothetical protein
MPQDILQRARGLYRRRRFSHAIRLLESQVFRFRENPDFFFLLGSSCLRRGDLGGAESYLKRADQLRPQDVPTLTGLAAIHLKRGAAEEALAIWLEITELAPANRQAARGLELLRRSAAQDNPQLLRDSGPSERLLPALPLNPRVVVLPLVGVAAAGLLAAAFVFAWPHLPRRSFTRPEIQSVFLSSTQPALTSGDPGAQLVLSEKQVQEAFARTKRYLLQYRDNLALREINRILLSNASPYVKEKAGLLATFVRQPDFTTIRDPFPYREVAGNPRLYSGCFVVWTGKAANVQAGPDKIVFDLLVGYASEKELQGVVPVTLGFAVELENGYGVEVLGKVEAADGALALSVVSLHRLYGIQ